MAGVPYRPLLPSYMVGVGDGEVGEGAHVVGLDRQPLQDIAINYYELLSNYSQLLPMRRACHGLL